MTNKELALTAVVDVFNKRDMTAFDKYFTKNYIQHNPLVPDGLEAVRKWVTSLPKDFRYDPGVITESDNIVMIHARLNNLYGKTYIAVDIFRVENGKLAEHWDVLQEEVPAEKSANGNPMFPVK
ncbi:MAG TPA: nuclear transport factor 2 family protein [Chitinophagaceae bacterium]|nr:nuclear transport factor 2 family protein [Chitinophagaceae bacterium]